MMKQFNVSTFLRLLQEKEDELLVRIHERLMKNDMSHWTDDDIDKGRFFYRGQSDARWGLEPGIFRNRWDVNRRLACNMNIGAIKRKINYVEQEKELLREVERRYASYFTRCHSTLDKLAVLQHYGLPTRLLDVTSNALVALYNAIGTPERVVCENGDICLNYMSNGKIFVFFVPLFEYEAAYGDQLKNISYADIEYSYVSHISRGHVPMHKLTPQFVCPTFLTDRQSRQQGSFFLVPSKGKFVVNGNRMYANAHPVAAEFENWRYGTIDIPKSAKDTLRRELAKHCGICDQFLYPETPDGYRQDLLDDLDSRI